jgi:hypothetical protein
VTKMPITRDHDVPVRAKLATYYYYTVLLVVQFVQYVYMYSRYFTY